MDQKIEIYLINVAIHNSFILFTQHNPQSKINHLNFRVKLSLFFLGLKNVDITKNVIDNFKIKNILEHIPNLGAVIKVFNLHLVSKKIVRAKTKYQCQICKNRKGKPVYLHPECFRLFHENEFGNNCLDSNISD
ncbi:hypothetical protein DMUE_4508 [Dictyocoela muelleri]|nr:hypothetical protein DMUE_4508 [Dictyocoela muelleri]